MTTSDKSPHLDHDTVRAVADLARLNLTDEEVVRFAGQLGQVLAHAEKLQAVNTADVPPTPYVLSLANVARGDEPAPGLSQEEALANAPEQDRGFFRVKSFFGS